MHKDDAAYLFGILSDGDKVKICKMLYVKGDLTGDQLSFIMGMYMEEFLPKVQPLVDNNLVNYDKDNDVYSINKETVDTLMSFISTPCGCTH